MLHVYIRRIANGIGALVVIITAILAWFRVF
jgi:hypothetical protein